MSRSRDVAQFLGKTDAANADNHALLNSSSGVDSAEVVTLITAHSSNLDSAGVITLVTANSTNLDSADIQTISTQVGGNRNLIINGDMQIWQRATAATAGANNTLNTVDRFGWLLNNDGAVTSEQSTDTPTGTGYSFLAKCTTADTSLAAGQYAAFYQNIEAQNLQRLEYGSSSAKTITLSFWVKSNKTGTYTVALYKAYNTPYIIPNEYTISSANTWEKKTITITPTAGSTSFITASGGAFVNNNTLGFQVAFNLAFGSTFHGTNNTWSSNASHYSTSNAVNWLDSTSNTFYISQVQLEVGDVATAFEHEDFGTTLRKCQRYYSQSTVSTNSGPWYHKVSQLADTYGRATIPFMTEMRASPTVTLVNMDLNYTSGGIQLISPSMCVPFINGISSSYYNHVQSWTANAEL